MQTQARPLPSAGRDTATAARRRRAPEAGGAPVTGPSRGRPPSPTASCRTRRSRRPCRLGSSSTRRAFPCSTSRKRSSGPRCSRPRRRTGPAQTGSSRRRGGACRGSRCRRSRSRPAGSTGCRRRCLSGGMGWQGGGPGVWSLNMMGAGGWRPTVRKQQDGSGTAHRRAQNQPVCEQASTRVPDWQQMLPMHVVPTAPVAQGVWGCAKLSLAGVCGTQSAVFARLNVPMRLSGAFAACHGTRYQGPCPPLCCSPHDRPLCTQHVTKPPETHSRCCRRAPGRRGSSRRRP